MYGAEKRKTIKDNAGYTYCISDIHNDYDSFARMLKLIQFSEKDKIYIIGDIFDRGEKPLELYYEILKNEKNIVCLCGNHDAWVAEHLYQYVNGRYKGYYYNTVGLLKSRITEVDMLNLISWIYSLDIQLSVNIEEKQFLLAHAQTSFPDADKDLNYYLMGAKDSKDYFDFLENGIEGYVSIIGHTPVDNIREFYGEAREKKNTVWFNRKKNVICIDCANGYRTEVFGKNRLGCIRLDDYQCFYV